MSRIQATFAALAGLSEMGGGILLALGLLTPVGASAVLAAMIVAIFSVHIKNGFFAMSNGIEMPFLYAVVALGLMFSGAGNLSLDSVLSLDFLNQPYVIGGLLVLTIVGAGATLGFRKQTTPQASAAHS